MATDRAKGPRHIRERARNATHRNAPQAALLREGPSVVPPLFSRPPWRGCGVAAPHRHRSRSVYYAGARAFIGGRRGQNTQGARDRKRAAEALCCGTPLLGCCRRACSAANGWMGCGTRDHASKPSIGGVLSGRQSCGDSAMEPPGPVCNPGVRASMGRRTRASARSTWDLAAGTAQHRANSLDSCPLSGTPPEWAARAPLCLEWCATKFGT